MKRLLLITMVLVLTATPVFARKSVESAHTSANSTSLAVAGTATIYTRSFPIFSVDSNDGQANDIGVAYQMSVATGDTAIYFEQSTQKPTTEGSSDATYMITHYIDTSVTDDKWHMTTVDTVELMYGRFKITGQGTNPNTTVLSIKYVK